MAVVVPVADVGRVGADAGAALELAGSALELSCVEKTRVQPGQQAGRHLLTPPFTPEVERLHPFERPFVLISFNSSHLVSTGCGSVSGPGGWGPPEKHASLLF